MTPRIVLFGPMGIGKTTAIRALCGDAVAGCEVANLDVEAHSKDTTTVGAEFGTVRLAEDEVLHIYGSPGQDRFGFVRQWLLSFAVGVLVLVDLAEGDALDYALQALEQAREHAPDAAALVLSARPATPAMVDAFARQLAERTGAAMPVLQLDVRDTRQMFDALELLVAMLEEA